MIKPQELRIGNLVFDKERNRIVTIWGIESNHDKIVVNYANGSGVYSIDLKHIEPIPLTEEILLRFGFEKDEDIPWTYIKKHIKINAGNHFTIFVFDKIINQDSIPKIHQLQNLYFDLTNEELELKEKATD